MKHMIGYTFPTSGATVLAVAPVDGQTSDYLVLARSPLQQDGETPRWEYVVATVADRLLVETQGSPTAWMHGDYFRSDRDAAVDAFAKRAGLHENLALRRRVERTETLIEAANTAAAQEA